MDDLAQGREGRAVIDLAFEFRKDVREGRFGRGGCVSPCVRDRRFAPVVLEADAQPDILDHHDVVPEKDGRVFGNDPDPPQEVYDFLGSRE